jgi:hypothetical protein
VIPIKQIQKNPNLIPKTGQSVEEGYFVKAAYPYLATRTHTASFLLDAMTRKGIGKGIEHNWKNGTTVGGAEFYQIYDNNINPNTTTGRASHSQMLGTCLFAIVYGLAHTVVILIVVALFFHLDLGRADLLGGLLVLLAGSLSFVGLGIMASVLPLLFTERGSQMTYIIQAVLLLISGVYYPVDVLPSWMQPITKLSPATYVLEGMRDSLLKGLGLEQLVRYLLILLVIGLVSLPIGMAVFNWGERYAKRTGKLKRSG